MPHSRKQTFAYLLLFLTLTACQVENKPVPPVEKTTEQKTEELIHAIYDFNLAFAAAEDEKLDTMLTSEYKHTNGSSAPYTKAIWLNYIQSRKAKLDSGVLVIHDYGMRDIEMTFYDNTALVNGVVYSQGSENGISFDKQFRVSHLWVYADERWKRAGFHDGIIE